MVKKEIAGWGADYAYSDITTIRHMSGSLTGLTQSTADGVGAADTRDMTIMSSEYDNLFTVEAIYKFQDLATVTLDVFQTSQATYAGSVNMNEDRNEDTGFFQSYAAKLEVTPVEGLAIQTSFVNAHNDSMDATSWLNAANPSIKDTVNSESTDDMMAVNVAVKYDFKSLPLGVYAEYMHVWNEGYLDDVDSDSVSLGAKYGVTENIDIFAMYEWLEQDIGGDSAGPRDANGDASTVAALAAGLDTECYWKEHELQVVQVGATYKFDHGIYMTLEYAHEWYDGKRNVSHDGVNQYTETGIDQSGDYVGFITGFSF